MVFWTDVSASPEPYAANEVERMTEEVGRLQGEANLKALRDHAAQLEPAKRRRLLPYEPRFVPRDKDLFDLFDTTPDLTGADVDVARFIRDSDELDVQVFWRDCSSLPREVPPKKWRPQHAELCPVPHSLEKRTGGFRQFAQQVLQRRKGRIWRWDYAKGWALLSLSELDRIYPGQVFLLEASCGGYAIATGWTGNSEDNP